jgi:hypothetical protein
VNIKICSTKPVHEPQLADRVAGGWRAAVDERDGRVAKGDAVKIVDMIRSELWPEGD